MFDINWSNEQIESHKFEYIAYKYNFFYEGHEQQMIVFSAFIYYPKPYITPNHLR